MSRECALCRPVVIRVDLDHRGEVTSSRQGKGATEGRQAKLFFGGSARHDTLLEDIREGDEYVFASMNCTLSSSSWRGPFPALTIPTYGRFGRTKDPAEVGLASPPRKKLSQLHAHIGLYFVPACLGARAWNRGYGRPCPRPSESWATMPLRARSGCNTYLHT